MPATNELLQEGRYRISQPSSQSRSETIYDAYDTVNATNVVVKEIPLSLNRGASQREGRKDEFAAQAKKLSGLKHDSLLHVRDYFTEADRQYLVMESVDGDTLHQLMQRNNRAFPLADVLNWADQLLDALNYLHTAVPPVIHKNIRPENIVLASNGRIKLFGVSPAEGTEAEISTSLSVSSHDAENRYSPLEQIWAGLDPASQNAIINGIDERSERILKEPADARSDIYSLGATLYYLVTGHEPVGALERAIEVLDGNPDPLKEPTKLDEQIPPEISDVLMKAMEIRRENRYDAAAIMRQVLKTAKLRAKDKLSAGPGDDSADDIVTIGDAEAAFVPPEDHILELEAPQTSFPPERLAGDRPDTEKSLKRSSAQADRKFSADAFNTTDELPSFGGGERARPGMNIPVIAGGAVAVVVIAVAVWFFVFSGSGGGDSPARMQPPVATQTAAQAAQPEPPAAAAPEPTAPPSAVPEQSDNDSTRASSTSDTVQPETRPAAKPAQPVQAKPKKETDAAKPQPKEKKTVTVDDLINGN